MTTPQTRSIRSVISIWIDTYDDIFSDFDPRPYSERTLSIDFLNEVRQASKVKSSGKLELKILVPKEVRDPQSEEKVIGRLLDYFIHHRDQSQIEIRAMKRKGILLTLAGESLIIGAAYLSKLLSENFWIHLLIVIFEPAGWFMTWAGLEDLIYEVKEKKAEVMFYAKMSSCEIHFWSL